MLVIDRAQQHMTAQARSAADDHDTDLVFIPAGCTYIVQPIYVSVNKPFKDHLKREWVAYMQEDRRTAKDNLKQLTRQHVIDWVSRAWDAVPSEVVNMLMNVQ